MMGLEEPGRPDTFFLKFHFRLESPRIAVSARVTTGMAEPRPARNFPAGGGSGELWWQAG